MKTFTSPVNLDSFNLSTVFKVCDVGQGNLAISKLIALKKFGQFLQSRYYWMSRSTFLGGGGAPPPKIVRLLISEYVDRKKGTIFFKLTNC
jgi:hypothetical protein